MKLENQSVYRRNSKHIRATPESITFDDDDDIAPVPDNVPTAARPNITLPDEAPPHDVQQRNPIAPHVVRSCADNERCRATRRQN